MKTLFGIFLIVLAGIGIGHFVKWAAGSLDEPQMYSAYCRDAARTWRNMDGYYPKDTADELAYPRLRSATRRASTIPTTRATEMNIFVLDENPTDAARYHFDDHVRRMILVYYQIMSSAHLINDNAQIAEKRGLQLVTWEGEYDHPCAQWARQSWANYSWLSALAVALTDQYVIRFGKQHALTAAVSKMHMMAPLNIRCHPERSPFVQMVGMYHSRKSAVEGYRDHYFYTKHHLAKWSVVGMPQWWKDMCGQEVES